jgi:hypothetical protein
LPGRKNPFRDPKPVILLVCEGSVTEPSYFKALRDHLELTSTFVEIVPGNICGSHPKSIVDYAKSRKPEFEIDDEAIEGKNIWCVFDRDEHAKIDDALKKAKDNDFGIAFSNPCFELWYLLHFEFQSAHIERNKATKKIDKKDRLKGYTKNMYVFDSLLYKMPVAIKHAEKLRERHNNIGDPETSNPSTTVDKLVKHLVTVSKQ